MRAAQEGSAGKVRCHWGLHHRMCLFLAESGSGCTLQHANQGSLRKEA